MKFLQQFDKKVTGSVTNLFLHPIREQKITDPWIAINAVLEDLRLQKKWRPLKKHCAIVEQQLFNVQAEDGDIVYWGETGLEEFLTYYLKYGQISLEDSDKRKFVTKKRKTAEKIRSRMDLSRPLSWSAISQWEYSKQEWFDKYVLGNKQPSTKEMDFGKQIGERLATDPKFLPQVPRLPVFEYKLETVLDGIPLIGYVDSFCPTRNFLLEFKTGKKAWTQGGADKHGQIDMYLLMHYLNTKTRPEDVRSKLVWLPTQESGDFSISLIEPVVPQIFETKRNTLQILKFAERIKKVYAEMQEYANKNSK